MVKLIALPFAAGMIVGCLSLLYDQAAWTTDERTNPTVDARPRSIAADRTGNRPQDRVASNPAGPCTLEHGRIESKMMVAAAQGRSDEDCPVLIERPLDRSGVPDARSVRHGR